MNELVALLLLPLCGACVTSGLTNANLLVGTRDLGEDVWSPAHEQESFGVEVDTRQPGKGLGFEYGLFHSSDTQNGVFVPGIGTVDATGTLTELSGGMRGTKDVGGGFHLYLGGGASLLFGDFEATIGGLTGSIDGAGVGLYAHTGAYKTFGDKVNVGVDLRQMFGSTMSFSGGADGDADGSTLSFFVGFAF